MSDAAKMFAGNVNVYGNQLGLNACMPGKKIISGLGGGRGWEWEGILLGHYIQMHYAPESLHQPNKDGWKGSRRLSLTLGNYMNVQEVVTHSLW